MKNRLVHSAAAKRAVIVGLLLACATMRAQNPPPNARDILRTARLEQATREINLQGQLRDGPTVVPFRLTQSGPVIRYSFSDPDEALQLRLGDNDSRLEQVTRSGTERITPAKFDDKVRGTGISYEDLALKFLYWSNAKIAGEETVRTRSCWKLEIHPPSHDSQYSSVNLWIDKSGGALMRMDGFDWNGRLVKRFEVVSAQKIDDRWFLKQMRIEQLDPATQRVVDRTYLEIKNS